MKVMKEIKKLCQPAYLYLLLSIVGMVSMIIQNLGNTDKYCVGNFECAVPNTLLVFVGKAIYVLFWTFILNALFLVIYTLIVYFLIGYNSFKKLS